VQTEAPARRERPPGDRTGCRLTLNQRAGRVLDPPCGTARTYEVALQLKPACASQGKFLCFTGPTPASTWAESILGRRRGNGAALLALAGGQ
jgi:hypothetical protein